MSNNKNIRPSVYSMNAQNRNSCLDEYNNNSFGGLSGSSMISKGSKYTNRDSSKSSRRFQLNKPLNENIKSQF